jgi:LacI family transcriptional regulator
LAKELGYVPNLSARNLRIKQSETIGIVVPDLTNTYFALIAEYVESEMHQAGYQTVVVSSQWDAKREMNAMHSFVQMRACGVLMCSIEDSSAPQEFLTKQGVPFLFLDTIPEDYMGCSVTIDFSSIGRVVAEHLLSAGCKRVAMVTAQKEQTCYSSLQAMQRSFVEVFSEQAGSPVRIPVLNEGLSIDAGRRGAKRLFDGFPEVDGVFCVNDDLAFGVMDVAGSSGRVVGRDLAVVGVDDRPVSGLSQLSLSSVRLPTREMVRLGVAALLNGIRGNAGLSDRKMLSSELVVRQSSRLG